MAAKDSSLSRREEILQALAKMLEASTSERITTAALAREVGVSEAALYRHFPSKARMYEELLAFAEETLFSTIKTVAASEENTATLCSKILLVALTFGERNPGITRLLCGDALHGEKPRLQHRAGQVFERLESDIRQAIRFGEVREGLAPALPPGLCASLLVNLVEGKLRRFLRSQYRYLPTTDWDAHWHVVGGGLFN